MTKVGQAQLTAPAQPLEAAWIVDALGDVTLGALQIVSGRPDRANVTLAAREDIVPTQLPHLSNAIVRALMDPSQEVVVRSSTLRSELQTSDEGEQIHGVAPSGDRTAKQSADDV
jgi:hypothetical protein